MLAFRTSTPGWYAVDAAVTAAIALSTALVLTSRRPELRWADVRGWNDSINSWSVLHPVLHIALSAATVGVVLGLIAHNLFLGPVVVAAVSWIGVRRQARQRDMPPTAWVIRVNDRIDLWIVRHPGLYVVLWAAIGGLFGVISSPYPVTGLALAAGAAVAAWTFVRGETRRRSLPPTAHS